MNNEIRTTPEQSVNWAGDNAQVIDIYFNDNGDVPQKPQVGGVIDLLVRGESAGAMSADYIITAKPIVSPKGTAKLFTSVATTLANAVTIAKSEDTYQRYRVTEDEFGVCYGVRVTITSALADEAQTVHARLIYVS